jgi:hypothetical protein
MVVSRMSRQVQVNAVATDQFPVWESDGYTKKSGETSFTVRLWKDGVVSSNPVTIVEIAASGEYKVTFIPDEMGFWLLEVSIPYNGQVWQGQFDVGSDQGEAQINVAYDDDTSTLYMDVWLDRDGTSVLATELVSCAVEIYDSNGASVLVASSGAADADGRFRMSDTLALISDRTYSAKVAVSDIRGTVITNQAFTTAG